MYMAVLVSTLYERNLFYQQVNFKWKSLVHLKNVLAGLSSLVSISKPKKTVLVMILTLVYLTDFVCGWIAYTTLTNNPALKHRLMNLISSYTITMLQWTTELIQWVMGIPGGLKLNTPLNHFLGTKFLGILELWQYFYSDFIESYLDFILTFLIILLPFGLTLFLSVLHDFLKFLNLCLICFFIFTSRIVSLQVSALKSLARLFMGTKWNVLKKRVDSCDYGTNQLLMGTILFTILLFLLPTTGVYFAIFLHLRMLQFAIQLSLRIVAVFVNKSVVCAWNFLILAIQDEPLTKLNMIVEFKEETSDASATVEADVKLIWNGEQYSVEEIQSVIKITPVQTILKQLNKDSDARSNGNGDHFDHPMLHLMGSIPIHFY